MENKKLTFSELCDLISEHNKEKGVKQQFSDSKPLNCVIVFTEDSFKEKYDETTRSYSFRSDNKYFLPSMLGNSIFGDCLDGDDLGVRLDWYMHDEVKPWKVEYCYIMEDK